MAAAAALCSSFTAGCSTISHQNLPSFSSLLKPPSLLPIYKPTSFNHIPSARTALAHVPKFSESQAAVAAYEDPEPSSQDDVQLANPKREEIFAVVMIGSRQYIVIPGRYIYTQRLKEANVNDKIVLNKVLLVGTKTSTYIGQPVVTNAAVHAVVEEQGLNAKVVVFKYKRKKHYRRNIGHRQPNTRIRITGITGFQDYPAVTLDTVDQK